MYNILLRLHTVYTLLFFCGISGRSRHLIGALNNNLLALFFLPVVAEISCIQASNLLSSTSILSFRYRYNQKYENLIAFGLSLNTRICLKANGSCSMFFLRLHAFADGNPCGAFLYFFFFFLLIKLHE